MDYNLVRKKEVSSTNSYLSDMLKADAGTYDTVLTADFQTDGRGQGKHGWDSNRGENILLSWLIYPEFLSASNQFQISKAVSLAICDHLGCYIGNTYIKWPNDILIGTRKIAGILIENSLVQDRIQRSIVGIGMNVNQHAFPDYPLKATSIFLETGREQDIEREFRKLIKALYIRYWQLRDGRFEEIDRNYLELLFRYRQPSIFEASGKTFEGEIRGVNEFGQLNVAVKGKIRTYNFQEIKLVMH